ncbi:MAG: SCP2 sterol-binding domain-containing protein [Lachnospiraceae bacterium]|nr:SCP2 sterol-binding domain-containing protein [Parasporobacterium sp.]MBR4169842.1 SCP2 sterol-binding domain-containing protein [Lachnospiraceae bacterium]
MKINIYYGGRGMMDDPTLYVLNQFETVLNELNVRVERFNLHEMKTKITSLPASINDADGIVLASTVEWYGIGGYMTQFLDACWLYGNREKIATTYMCPIVMSTTSGEREAKTSLAIAWEILGGLPCSGLCGYVEDMVSFELNKDYQNIIEKKAENMYRTISQKTMSLPASNQAVKRMVDVTSKIAMTPQETDILSQYAADEDYVARQREDIQELTSFFKEKLEQKDVDENLIYIEDLKSHFDPHGSVNATYKFMIKERKKPLIVEIAESELNCYYGNMENPDVLCKMDADIMEQIISGRITFQRAFMSGQMQVKGDFRLLRMLDQVFIFESEEE